MTLNLISLSTVKTELGINNNDYDTSITAMIPKVSADVRRILNNQYDTICAASYESGAAVIEIYNGVSLGDVITGTGIPDDTYLQSYDYDEAEYTASADFTDTNDYVYPTINISQWSAISKMIWYRIGKLVTTDVTDKAVSSESYGPVSKTYTDAEINSKWNYPQALIDDLGTPFAKVG